MNTKFSIVESEEYAIYMYREMATFDVDWELKLTDTQETARHTCCPSHVTPHSIHSLRGLNRYSSTVKNFMYIINLIKMIEKVSKFTYPTLQHREQNTKSKFSVDMGIYTLCTS